MGYSERHCQLCGVSFNVARIRKADEPESAAWGNYGIDFMTAADAATACEIEGCSNIPRPEHPDPNVSAAGEHIAGPNCELTLGYSGWRITAEEMRDILRCLCIAAKSEDWQPEVGDKDYEVDATYCFVAGVSHSPDEFSAEEMTPVRHGLEQTMINNEAMEGLGSDEEWAIPVHEACFQMFERVSREKLGKVDLDGLWRLRDIEGDWPEGFKDPLKRSDIGIVSEQYYDCVQGTEYLVSHPLRVLGLDQLINSCALDGEASCEVVFNVGQAVESHYDPFAALSPELCELLLGHLERRDVANLRLASRCFRQLPQLYFRRLVETEMPWIWEVATLKGRKVDWHNLWCRLSAADGGAGMDAKERHWLQQLPQDKNEILRQQLRKEGLTGMEMSKEWAKRSLNLKQEVDDDIKAANDAGKWPADTRNAAEIRGLRNRRRIWEDLEEIVKRIAALPPVEEDEDAESRVW
ncbi:hypothetical protein LTR17_005347 [Elasticomyces elasticus]|nr:hypothetical protein LTR17_005347 [Elasticomyces elasticus]